LDWLKFAETVVEQVSFAPLNRPGFAGGHFV
jgi:hypothetical protein